MTKTGSAIALMTPSQEGLRRLQFALRRDDLLVAFLFRQVREHEAENHLRPFALQAGGRQIDGHQTAVAGFQVDFPAAGRCAGLREDGVKRLLRSAQQILQPPLFSDRK